MIGRNDGKGFLAAHWDWLVSFAGLAALAGCGALLFIAKQEDPERARAEESAQGKAPESANTGVAAADMAGFALARKVVETPTRVPETPDAKQSFLAPGMRVFCEQGDPADEKKACGLPIPFGEKKCPLCGVKQPEEQKVVLDTDGDGLPDELEKTLGMNPNDPNDVGGDLDGDGFTNLEEYEAKTDLRDPESHPDYLDYVKIVLPLRVKPLPFVFTGVRKRSGDAYEMQFRDPRKVNDAGTRGFIYSVAPGAPIGETGFRAKAYEQKADKVPIPGTNLTRDRDISTATVERISDGKLLTLQVGVIQHVAADVETTLVYERDPSLTFAVSPGGTIQIKRAKYTVKDIRREGKAVKVDLTSEKFGNKTLQALEP